MDLNEILESENPSASLCNYAYIYGRLSPEWERLLLEFKDVFWIVFYAEKIIEERWYEIESTILESKNINGIMCYAMWVIKDRWPEAEEKIKQNPTYWEIYLWHFNTKLKEENGHK